MQQYPFNYTTGPHNAKVLFVNECWSGTDYDFKTPLYGEAGRIFNNALTQAGFSRDDVLVASLVDDRPYDDEFVRWFYPNGWARQKGIEPTQCLYPSRKVLDGLDKLYALIRKVKPELIVAMGNYALWALDPEAVKYPVKSGRTVPTGAMKMRGSMTYTNHPRVERTKLLPTLNPELVALAYPWHKALYRDFSFRIPMALENRWNMPPYSFKVMPRFSEVVDTLSALRNYKAPIACDIETKWNSIVCIGFAWSKTEAISIPLLNADATRYWPLAEDAAIWAELQRIFMTKKLFGQFFNYDRWYIYHEYGIIPEIDWDTMGAEHLLYPDMPRSLDYLSSMYLPYHMYWKDDGKEWSKENDLERLCTYNCRDAVVTWAVRPEQKNALDSAGLMHLMPERLELMDQALRMSIDGICIDDKVRQEQRAQLQLTQDAIALELEYFVPDSVYPKKKTPFYRSPTQLMELLYEYMKLKPELKRGRWTTEDKALVNLSNRNPALSPFFSKLQEYRSLGKFMEFCDMELEPNGKLCPTWNTSSVKTFRRATHENPFWRAGNVQNISSGN